MIYPERFFKVVLQGLPKNPVRVYGGVPYDRWSCGGGPGRPHCDQLVGTTYMSGELYFLSTDLSQFITGHKLNRSAVYISKEDMCTGNYVHSHPLPIVQIAIQRSHKVWDHGDHLKEPESYEVLWGLHLRRQSSLLQFSWKEIKLVVWTKARRWLLNS